MFMKERYRLSDSERQEYEEALVHVLDRNPATQIPSRIRAYYYQVKMGSRTPRDATRKLNQFLTWKERKSPELVDYYSTPDSKTKLTPIMAERQRIISSERWSQLDAQSAQRLR